MIPTLHHVHVVVQPYAYAYCLPMPHLKVFSRQRQDRDCAVHRYNHNEALDEFGRASLYNRRVLYCPSTARLADTQAEAQFEAGR